MDPRLPEPPGSPRLLRARGVGEILVDAFEIYRRHWQNLIAIVAVVVVPLTILQVVLVDAFVDDVQVQELPDGTVQVTGDLGSAVAGGIVLFVVFTLAFMVLTGAMTRAAAGTFLARDLTIAETYRYGFARLGSILLVAVLTVLAVIGGFILLIIPGFIVLTRLWVSTAPVVPPKPTPKPSPKPKPRGPHGAKAPHQGRRGGLCGAQGDRRTRHRADQTGAGLPAILAARFGERPRGVGIGLHDAQHSQAVSPLRIRASGSRRPSRSGTGGTPTGPSPRPMTGSVSGIA